MFKKFVALSLAILLSILCIPIQGVQAQEEALINYILVDKPQVDPGDTQYIIAGIGKEGTQIELAQLSVEHVENGEITTVESDMVSDQGVRFSIPYTEDARQGTYRLKTLTYVADHATRTVDLADVGLDAVYGVGMEVATTPDAVVTDEEDETPDVSVDIVQMDENGNETSDTTVEAALSNAQAETYSVLDEQIQPRSGSGIVIVLDPGHDNTHRGATSPSGLREEQLTLKIAQYCKQELEQYANVTVYLTRGEDGSCPYPGTNAGDCNEGRVQFAKSVGATAYVSIHLNSAGTSAAHGVEIYYPNTNYNSAVSQEGEKLAEDILEELTNLGLYNRGTKVENSKDNTLYPDGSLADYYGVIRNSKLEGIPAIIIEHAFLTNTSDVNNYLNSDEKLKELGVADATGIAKAYGLEKSWSATGIYLMDHSYNKITLGMVARNVNGEDLEYRWQVCDADTNEWFYMQDWTTNNEWFSWNPGRSGNFVILGEVRSVSNPEVFYQFSIGIPHSQFIKGICQMPYTGEGGGFLIGLESNENPNQSYQYEMQILDCTLLAQGKPAWIYTNGKTTVSEGNAMWTIWQPQYGYYWTLFRVYDAQGNLLEEQCFGFENI